IQVASKKVKIAFENADLSLRVELIPSKIKKHYVKQCAFEIDLQKAYDIINWDLRMVLEKFKFPKRMVDWIIVCVITTKFSLNVNGERVGYFSRGRGLRQNDHMSLYLFTPVVEVLNMIRLYCWGKDNGVNILKSIDEGPYKMGTFRETLAGSTKGTPLFGPERPRVYSDLSTEKKDRYNADIRATNILLQGLPKDIYTLINHYIDAKYIWDNVKMLLEGSELTKEDRESQLYDNFKHFRQHKEESIHDYYVRFAKLINDMRNIKMTMSKLQLNSKFVNNMLPEWGRFVTAVKLNRGLRDSNYDQLFAYLKQHEAHAKENKMMLERLS
nr:RNA-directed DNA polymerase, eukaryota, reverse transcriptase zinc-binding domain protein [Tanacetum cinerariifolium]